MKEERVVTAMTKMGRRAIVALGLNNPRRSSQLAAVREVFAWIDEHSEHTVPHELTVDELEDLVGYAQVHGIRPMIQNLLHIRVRSDNAVELEKILSSVTGNPDPELCSELADHLDRHGVVAPGHHGEDDSGEDEGI